MFIHQHRASGHDTVRGDIDNAGRDNNSACVCAHSHPDF
jgi:hypothetical protein